MEASTSKINLPAKRVANAEDAQARSKRVKFSSDEVNSNAAPQGPGGEQDVGHLSDPGYPSKEGVGLPENDRAGEDEEGVGGGVGTGAEGTFGPSQQPQQLEQQQKGKRDAAGWAKSRKGKVKSTKNTGRRRRETKDSMTDETTNVEGGLGTEQSTEPKEPRLPKRMCALLIGFCGSGYSGMQIQPESVKTIEGVLFQALVKIGAVSKDNADDPVKVSLGRAARTDAGVHAAGNVVSMKLIITIPGVPNLVERLNEELPPDIRVWGYVRAQNSFHARLQCDSRKYTYFFPTYLLLPPKPNSGLDRVLQQHASSQHSISSNLPITSHSAPPKATPAEEASSPSSTAAPLPTPRSAISSTSDPVNSNDDGITIQGEQRTTPGQPDYAFWKIKDATREEELCRKRAWRVSTDMVDRLRGVVRKYEGTHNFHNFTVGRPYSDRSSMRHMKKIEVAEPVVYGETEWISVMFHGQSFMLHQRKMMSGIVLSCRTGTPESVIDEIYGPSMVFVPKMPSLGLLLEEPIFDSYNSKIETFSQKLIPTDPDYRPPIDFSVHMDRIQEFKQKYIYDNMRRVEDRNGLFDAWIRSVDNYQGNDLLYLNPQGNLPPEAVIKLGERRENPFREKKLFDSTSFTIGGGIKNTIAATSAAQLQDGQVQADEEEEFENEEVVDRKELMEMEG